MCAKSVNHAQIYATPWTVAHQASLSWDSPGKNTGMGCHVLLQGIFLIQGLNPHLIPPALAGRFSITSTTWKAHSYRKDKKLS